MTGVRSPGLTVVAAWSDWKLTLFVAVTVVVQIPVRLMVNAMVPMVPVTGGDGSRQVFSQE